MTTLNLFEALALVGVAAPIAAFSISSTALSIRANSLHGGAVSGIKFHRAVVSAPARAPFGLTMKKDPAGGRGGEESDPRRQALDGVLHQIERCYGRGSILKMGDTNAMNVETTSTGETKFTSCKISFNISHNKQVVSNIQYLSFEFDMRNRTSK